tara:strand:- start:111 stop:221 length:111 start_codon:yes stop_codon:yes gene_type:complete
MNVNLKNGLPTDSLGSSEFDWLKYVLAENFNLSAKL